MIACVGGCKCDGWGNTLAEVFVLCGGFVGWVCEYFGLIFRVLLWVLGKVIWFGVGWVLCVVFDLYF